MVRLFWMLGSNNDINNLERSPLVQCMLQYEGLNIHFEINSEFYDFYFLFVDGVYPQSSCFVQTIHLPNKEKRKHFAKVQEAVRKDVEQPCRQWSMSTITSIIFACVVLHNLILDDEKSLDLEDLNLRGPITFRRGLTLWDLMLQTQEIENEDIHHNCRGYLIKHLWSLKGARLYWNCIHL